MDKYVLNVQRNKRSFSIQICEFVQALQSLACVSIISASPFHLPVSTVSGCMLMLILSQTASLFPIFTSKNFLVVVVAFCFRRNLS